MNADREVDISEWTAVDNIDDELIDAVDLASDQEHMTWLIRDGRRIAAIVPVSQAEFSVRGAVVASAAARELGRLADQAVQAFNLVSEETGGDWMRVTRVRRPTT